MRYQLRTGATWTEQVLRLQQAVDRSLRATDIGSVLLDEAGAVLETDACKTLLCEKLLMPGQAFSDFLVAPSQEQLVHHLARVRVSGTVLPIRLSLRQKHRCLLATTALVAPATATQPALFQLAVTPLGDPTLPSVPVTPEYLVAQHTRDLVCLHDLEGRYRWVSPSVRSLFGYEPEALLGESPYAYFHPDDADRIRADSHDPSRRGDPRDAIVYRFRHADGSYRWLETLTTPIADSTGTPVQLLTVSRDVTEQHTLQLRLEEKERHFRTLAEHLPFAVARLDCSLRYVYVNPMVTRMSGLPPEAFLGHTPAELDLPASFTADWEAQVTEVIHTRRSRTLESVLPRPPCLREGNGYYRRTLVPELDETGAVTSVLVVGQNETERRRLIDTLQAREAEARRLAMLARHTVNGVLFTDADGHIDWVNEGFQRLTGYTLAEVQGQVFYDVLQGPGTDLAALQQLREHLQARRSWEHEVCHYTRVGTPYWSHLQIQPLFEEDACVGFVVLEADVTAHRQAEAERRNTLRLLEATEAIARTGGWRYQVQTGQAFWTPGVYRIYGLDPAAGPPSVAEGIGYYHPDDRARIQAAFAACLEGESYDLELRLLTPSGQTRWVRVQGYPIVENGVVIEVFGVIADITTQHDNQETIRVSRQRLYEIAQRVPVTIIQATVSAEGRFGFEFANDQIERMLGVPASVAVRDAFESLQYVDAADRARILRSIRRHVVTQRALVESFQVHLPEQAPRWIQLETSIPRMIDGALHFFAILSDITTARETEEQLILARREAEAASRAKSVMLTTMSHEIRTPLTGILGISEILKDDLADPEFQEMAEMMHQSGLRLLETLNAVLDLAQIESGQYPFNPMPFDLAARVATSVQFWQTAAQRKGLDLQFAPGFPPHLSVLQDQQGMERILNNLLSNAIKYTKAGQVVLDLRTDGEAFLLSVADTGIGIAEEALPKIFHPFNQEETGLNRSYEGTGLGLAIVRELVEIMGGTIAVASTKGEGSTFTVRLPQRVALPEEAASPLVS